MKTFKKITITFIVLALATSLFAGGSSETSSSKDASETTIKLGIVGSVYEDIWAPAKETLEKEGINLEFVQFSDYVTPNNALASGEIDLNAFQHRVFFENEINSYGYDLSIVGNTFIIPLNLYSDKVTSVSQIKDGDIIAIPNDPTNGGRALKVLSDAGLIKLRADAGFNPTVEDIETYNVKIQIKELAANTIASVLPDVTAGIVNGNYALDFGLKTDETIFKDTSINEKNYWCLIAARTKDLSDPKKVELYKKVVKAFQTQATEDVFNNDFGGYFIAVGWGEDLLAGK